MTTAAQPQHAHPPSQDSVRDRVRWLWVPVMTVALCWYFLGYVKSLDGYLAPLYDRWPVLRDWVAQIPV